MAIKERLVALDRKTLGSAYDADSGPTPRSVKIPTGAMPAITGITAYVAAFIDRAAGVGVVIGVLIMLPLAVATRISAKVKAAGPAAD